MQKGRDHYEKVKGTWAYEFRSHFEAFSLFCWEGFNRACEAMREESGMLALDKYKWREYVLWDMQNKHDRECGTANFPRERIDVDGEIA